MTPSPEILLTQTLTRHKLRFALAESCSGGLIAHRVTNLSGVSACFLGGVVAYSNEAKERILGVAQDTLAQFGAVSEPVAREMASGAQRIFGAECAAAVTGIAGPTGGTAEKPVGLVYIAAAVGDQIRVERHVFEGDRDAVKRQTADRALTLLKECIE